MRIIDAMQKITNGEEFRFKILSENKTYHVYKDSQVFDEEDEDYVQWFIDYDWLNEEIEIIKEDKKKEENKEIEGLWITSSGLHSGEMSNGYEEENLKDIVKHNFNVIHNKINEIIIVINEMRGDK